MSGIRAAVVGASGYTGGELLRYLAQHPGFELVWATADRNMGRRVGEVFGHLPAFAHVVLEATSVDGAPHLDVAFLALPHGQAAAIGADLAARGVKVVDLSADWRLRDPADYDTWYGWSHPAPEAIDDWVYGLPEVYRKEVGAASTVANPGCYPTAALLPLVPALRAGLLEPEGIVIAAASGVSGAGRKVDAAFLFSELDGSCGAYGVGRHRHTPEIDQELSVAAGTDVRATFTPHLVPMARGLLATCYAKVAGDSRRLREALESAYASEPFVRVLPEGIQPHTKQVAGSNLALIGIGVDGHTDTAVLTCAIDNLGKGAAGQAIQNANIMCDLEETTGLGQQGVYP